MSRTALMPGWYIKFQADMLQQLPRPGTIDQTTAEGWSGNQEALKKVLAEVLLPGDAMQEFILLYAFNLMVPDNYDHSTQLASFKKKNREDFLFYSDVITDEKFANATQRLIPGKTYKVKIFRTTHWVYSEECLEFLKSQNAILVGAQGISLVWDLRKDNLCFGRTISFDQKKALPTDQFDFHRVPFITRRENGKGSFDIATFDGDWCRDEYLLCVCEE